MLAQTTFDEMVANGVTPTLVTYGALLSACENGRQWKTALSLLDEMPMKPDHVAYNAVIGACNKANRWAEAISVLDQMDRKKVPPDQKAFDMVARMCLKAGQYDEASQVCQRARRRGIEVCPQVQDDLSTKASESLSEGRQQLTPPPDSVKTASITEHSQTGEKDESGQWKGPRDESIEAWRERAMKAWRRGGNWQEALAFLRGNEYAGAAPGSQASFLDDAMCACGRGGAWEQALNIYFEMSQWQITPSAESMLEVASACEAAKQDKWSRVLRDQCRLLSETNVTA